MTNGLLDTLNDTSASLATLTLQVRAEALAGLGSRSKVAEHVLLSSQASCKRIAQAWTFSGEG